jgi:hypothetical protein
MIERFIDVEANSEDEAKDKVCAELIRQLQDEDPPVTGWEITPVVLRYFNKLTAE